LLLFVPLSGPPPDVWYNTKGAMEEQKDITLHMISGFNHKLAQKCALLGY
jgi:hypothetical protein